MKFIIRFAFAIGLAFIGLIILMNLLHQDEELALAAHTSFEGENATPSQQLTQSRPTASPAGHSRGAVPARLPSTPGMGTTSYVTVCRPTTVTCDYDSVQAAANNVPVGVLIKVAAGVYTDTDGDGVVLHLTRSLMLQGGYTTSDWTKPDPVLHPTVLDGENGSRVVYVDGNSSPQVKGFHIRRGHTTGDGGGVYITSGSGSPLVESNHIYSNTAGGNGGGVYIGGGRASVQRNRIYANTATGWGGGVYVAAGSPVLENNLLYSNQARNGGGIYLRSGSALVQYNTLYSNRAILDGGGIYFIGMPVIRASIIVQNAASNGGGIHRGGGSYLPEYNDVWNNSGGDYGGFGVVVPPKDIHADPLFADAGMADFHLSSGSPCVDAADPAHYPEYDYDGYARPFGAIPDIGAHEQYSGTCFVRLNGRGQVFASVQEGIDAGSSPADVVQVAGLCRVMDGSPAAYIDRALTLRGGYTLTNWEEADWVANRTILDADGKGRVIHIAADIPAPGGVTIEGFDIRNGYAASSGGGGIYAEDIAYTVIRHNRIYSNTTATGLPGGGIYLKGGDHTLQDNQVYGNSTGGNGNGGGIAINTGTAGGNPTLTGNLIHHNTAGGEGGGLYTWVYRGYTLTVLHNQIYGNTAQKGGGVSLGKGASELRDNEIYSNTATLWGGGISFDGGSTVIEDNRIYGNRVTAVASEDGGGGIYIATSTELWSADHVTVRRNLIYANSAADPGGDRARGGGIHAILRHPNEGEIVLEANQVYSNSSTYRGGGIYVNLDTARVATISVRNNLVYGNAADDDGGGIACRVRQPAGRVEVEHNTVYGNGATNGGGLHQQDLAPILRNNAIISNTGGGAMAGDGAPDATCDYCDIYGNVGGDGGGGSGAISADPQFVDVDAANFRLRSGSPCIEAAHPVSYTAYDFDGYARPFGARADIGAHEYYTGTCLARLMSSGRVYTTVQEAVDAATVSGVPLPEVRVAGVCRESVVVTGPLALLGGYVITQWSAPLTPTYLGAPVGGGRVLYVTGAHTSTLVIGEFVISGGNVTGDGGGIYIAAPLSPTIRNVVLYGNSATGNGGGLASVGGNPRLYNNTVVYNTAGNGGGLYFAAGQPVVSNTIVASNTLRGIYAASGVATPTLDYNDVWNNNGGNYGGSAVPGAHSISEDPRLEGVYRLRVDSPCLHAGQVGVGWDFEGDARPLGRAADIGADERALYPDLLFMPEHLENHNGVPGESVVFIHYLTNTGTLPDTFYLSSRITDTGGGGWSVAHPISLHLAPGAATAVPVTVSVPADGISGTYAVAVLTGTSALNTRIHSVVDNATFIEWKPGVLLTPAYDERVNPGATITYVHIISNTGNASDTFDLNISSTRHWAVITPTRVALGPRAWANVWVAVSAPAYAPGGTVEETTVSASSTGSGASGTVVDRTTVNHTPGDRYVATTGNDTFNNCHVITSPCRTIAYAVSQATSRDVIKVAGGTYYEHDILVNKDVTLRGGYSGFGDWEFRPRTYTTTLDAEGRGRVFYILGSPTVEGFTIRGGATDGLGGGIYMELGRPTIQRNRITGNSAVRGGGIAGNYARPNLWNNFIYGNSAAGYGGGVYLAGGGGYIWHDTFYSNTASLGGGVYLAAASPQIYNTIVAGNSATGGGGGIYASGGVPVLDYNDVWSNIGGDYSGVVSGAHSISGDPLFVGAAAGDFHLRADSPCINVGVATTLREDFDDHEQRPMGSAPDIGADEFLQPWVTLRPDRSGLAYPAMVITYAHQLINTGVRRDTFVLSAQSNLGWVITPTRPVTLEAGSGTDVIFTTTIPANVLSGTVHTAILTATSLYNPAVFDTAFETTTIGFSHTLIFTPSQVIRITSDPYNPVLVNFQHRLINTGNYTASFEIVRMPPYGSLPVWWSPQQVTLAMGQEAIVSVTMRVPPLPTDTLGVNVEHLAAVSLRDPAVYGMVTDTLLVNIIPGVELAPNREGRGKPGETVYYAHILTNTGNYDDAYTLSAVSSNGWQLTAPVSQVVGPGLSRVVYLSVPIPAGTLSGTVDVETLRATSGWDPGVKAMVVNTTTVEQLVDVAADTYLPPLGWCVPEGYGDDVPYWVTVLNEGNYTDTFDITAWSMEGISVTIRLWRTPSRLTQGLPGVDTGDTCHPPKAGLPLTLDNGVPAGVPEAQSAVSAESQVRGIAAPLEASAATSVTLPPGGTAVFLVEVAMDWSRTGFYVDVVTVTARSRTDESVMDQAVFISRINWMAYAAIGPDQSRTVLTDEVITYVLNITYTGNVAQNQVRVSVDRSTQGWDTLITPDYLTMTQGQVESVYVRMEIPLDVIRATDVTRIKAETLEDCLSKDVAVLTTTVRRPHVRLYPDHGDIVIPGTSVVYNHVLENDGLFTDTYALEYTLAYSAGVGWSASVAPTMVYTLPPGSSMPVVATVDVPAGLISGTRALMLVTARSVNYPPIRASAVNTMTVPYLPGAVIQPSYHTYAYPGDVVVYTHTLTNTGNYTLTFDLATHSLFGYAEIIEPPAGIAGPLGPGEATTIVIQVHIPEHAASDETESTEVIAAFPEGQAVVVDYTTIRPVTGTRYVAPYGSDLYNNCTRLDYGPCATPQHAVDQAAPGDSILVAEGVYYGAVGAGEVISIYKSVALIGGHMAGNWSERDPVAHPTVLDARGQGRVVSIGGVISPTLEGFHLRNGRVEGPGAGLYITAGARPTVRDNFIHDNTAIGFEGQGGGIYYAGEDSPVLERNTVYDNRAAEGAGLYLAGGSPRVWNNVIYGNVAGWVGGGLHLTEGTPEVWNNTFYSNSALLGGGIYVVGGSLSVSNTIMARHSGYGLYMAGGTSALDYSAWWDNTPAHYTGTGIIVGGHNLYADPRFLSAATGDLRLLKDSPCIDAADPHTAVSEDREGNRRPLFSGYDVGAYEYGLEAAKYAIPETVMPGEMLTCTIVVTNTGAARSDIVITDTLHPFLDCTAGRLEWDGWITGSGRYEKNPCRITWNGRMITGTAVITFTAQVTDWLAAGTLITNVGWVNMDATDVVTVSVAPRPGIRYVATTGSDAPYNGCLSPYHPCRTIQRAVDQALEGDPVYIAMGVYTSTGAVARVEHKSLALRGGFTTTLPLWSHNAAAYTTTLNGRNAYTVVLVAGTPTHTVTLADLHITNGVGGVSAGGATVVISRCHIYGNALNGIRVTDGALTLAQSWVLSNGDYGISVDGSTYLVDNAIIARNSGGIRATGGSDGLLRHTTFAENGARGALVAGGTATLVNTIFSTHTVGIEATGGAAVLTSTLWHNNATPATGNVLRSNDHFGEPAFAYPAGMDYHLTTESDAVDRGVDAGLREDVDGDMRPAGQGYDLGADELRVGLSVVKSASPDPVEAGASITYTIYLTNTGDFTLHAAVVDKLPEQLTTTQALIWTPTILAGEVWSTSFAAQVAWSYSGILTNVVQVTTLEGAYGAYTHTAHARVTPAVTVAKLAYPDPVQAGSALTYTLYVTNTGNTELHVVITDTLPVQVYPAGTLTWTANLPAPGGVWTESVVVTVAWSYSGTLTNLVEVNAAEGASATHVATTTARVSPALRVAKQVTPTIVRDGAPLTCTLYVTNTGNVDLSVVITDLLPVHVTPTGWLTWTALLRAPGGVWTHTFVITAETGYDGPIVNRVEARSADGAYDTAAVTATVKGPPGLSISKMPEPVSVLPGGLLSYTLVVSNAGPGEATGLVISDVLPAQVIYVACSGAETCGYNAATGVVTWTTGSLAAGQRLVVALTVRARSDLEYGSLIVNGDYGVSCAEGPGDTGTPVSVAVGVVGGVELSAGQARTALPGEQIVYTHTITNTANVTQAVTITFASSQRWATVAPTVTAQLAPYTGVTQVTVTVNVPPTAISGAVESTVLTVTGGIVGQDTAENLTTVGMFGGVELSAGQARTALPGEQIVYIHTVTNTANVTQAVTITFSSSQQWATVMPLVTAQLAPYAGATQVTVTVNVPSAAVSGTRETTVLTATGWLTGQDTAYDLTTVGCSMISSAGFSFDPVGPLVGEEVTFHGWATGTLPLTFSWNFGDGSPVQQGNPVVHTFPLTVVVQTYPVTMTVTNPCTEGFAVSRNVTVRPRTVYLPIVLR